MTEHTSTGDNAKYMAELLAEKDKISPLKDILIHISRLLDNEIERIKTQPYVPVNLGPGVGELGTTKTETLIVDGKLHRKVFVPVELKPSFNFVGKLLGYRGTTLQYIERESGAKIMIRGKGSTRDSKPTPPCKFGNGCGRRDKCPFLHPGQTEQDSINKQFDHLNEPLHVLIITTPDLRGEECARIAQQLVEPLLLPDDTPTTTISPAAYGFPFTGLTSLPTDPTYAAAVASMYSGVSNQILIPATTHLSQTGSDGKSAYPQRYQPF